MLIQKNLISVIISPKEESAAEMRLWLSSRARMVGADEFLMDDSTFAAFVAHFDVVDGKEDKMLLTRAQHTFVDRHNREHTQSSENVPVPAL